MPGDYSNVLHNVVNFSVGVQLKPQLWILDIKISNEKRG